MLIPQLSVFIGESIPIRYSFLSLLSDFQGTAQSLTGASITWASQTPSLATFDTGSEGLVSSDQGIAEGIPNDAVIGSFTMLASGICTVQVTVDAINPTATYVGAIRLSIEPIPVP